MEKIDRFQVVRKLGGGGMGVVYLAHDPRLDRDVAVKVLHTPPAWQKAEVLMRALREGQAAARLEHANIVKVFDVLQHEGSLCIVMAYVAGESLQTLYPLGRVARPEEAVSVLRQVAEALDYMHGEKVVHRDIKPANIMVNEKGRALITDFGIARLEDREGLTGTGFALGTYEYMSKEQFECQPATGLSDQYALAVVTYGLLTGARLYDGESEMFAWARKVVDGEAPVRASLRNPSLPAAVDAVLERALSEDASRRFATCSEFVNALSGAFTQRTVDETRPNPKVEPVRDNGGGRTGSRSRLWVAAIVLAAAVGAVVYAVLPTGQKSEDPAAKSAPLEGVEAVNGPPAGATRGQAWRNPVDGQDYVFVSPADGTRVGCAEGDPRCESNEPSHTATLPRTGYWLGKTEVSVRAYRVFSQAGKTSMPPAPADFDSNWQAADHPIVNVTQAEAAAYCKWMGGRLPTDDEWEYAAMQGLSGNERWNGSGDDGADYTTAVLIGPSNGLGMYNVLGNAGEWAAAAGIVRGGSFQTKSANLRVSQRLEVDAAGRNFAFGMRCAIEGR